MTRNERIVVLAIGGVLLAGAVGLGYLLGTGRDTTATSTMPATPAEKEVLYWYDPMVPDQHFDKPGKSPFMDMELVPKYADDADAAGTVRIDPATVQNLDVRTATVERAALPTGLVVPGTLAWNQRTAFQVSARAGGVVQRLYVRAPF